MRKYILLAWFIPFVSDSMAQSTWKTMLRLPDTGENKSYTNTFGEDNDYTINPPAFKLNGNGTVTDSITGLMWQQNDGGEMMIENAIIYCDTLTLGGYTDWRLPNAHEAFSILNHQYTNPAMDVSVFKTTAAEYWWTSDRQANDQSKIWVTNAGGGIGNHPKTETITAGGTKRFHVRAVRDAIDPSFIPNHFTNNGNGTITDHLTNLVWQQIPFSDSLTWENALKLADTSSMAGITEWRLPNIKEIQSINNESIINPSVNPIYFPNIGIRRYWSSTTLPNQTTKAWYLDTHFGITSYQTKTSRLNVLLVSGNGEVPTGWQLTNSETGRVVFPNPFRNAIHLIRKHPNESYQLVNYLGQLIYSGKNIEENDFSDIPSGMYLLKIIGPYSNIIKLLKE